MTLETYISTVLTKLPGKAKVKFNIGLETIGTDVFVKEDSLNRIEFWINRKDVKSVDVEKILL
jgi:hypothetical protein